MKRSSLVALAVLGAATAGCVDDRSAPAQSSQNTESLAVPPNRKPRCDQPEDFSLPRCHDPSTNPVAATSSSAPRSSGIVVIPHAFYAGGSSSYGPTTTSAAAVAARPSTTYGGYGATGRAIASAAS